MRVEINELGEVWYYPDNSNHPPQLLADSDSLCGIGIFETGHDDPLRDCCSWHDKAYIHRAFFEERGWDRNRIDRYFLSLMLTIAGNNHELICRASRYYAIVRCIGWVFYYRHAGYSGPGNARNDDTMVLAFLQDLRPDGVMIA